MTDFKSILLWSSLLLLTCATLLLCSRPKAGHLPPALELNNKSLDPDRQAIWIRVDSLRTWLDPLAEANAFVWSDKDSKLVFIPSEAPQTFEEVFLDNQPLSIYAELANPIIKPLKNGGGFEAQVIEKNNIRLVQLPAEIIQSIQLYIKNTQITRQ